MFRRRIYTLEGPGKRGDRKAKYNWQVIYGAERYKALLIESYGGLGCPKGFAWLLGNAEVGNKLLERINNCLQKEQQRFGLQPADLLLQEHVDDAVTEAFLTERMQVLENACNDAKFAQMARKAGQGFMDSILPKSGTIGEETVEECLANARQSYMTMLPVEATGPRETELYSPAELEQVQRPEITANDSWGAW